MGHCFLGQADGSEDSNLPLALLDIGLDREDELEKGEQEEHGRDQSEHNLGEEEAFTHHLLDLSQVYDVRGLSVDFALDARLQLNDVLVSRLRSQFDAQSLLRNIPV